MYKISGANLIVAGFAVILFVSIEAFSQVQYPRPSQRQKIVQTIGDTEVRIVYHRPNLRNRKAFGDSEAIVPYGRVWRAGANEATLFEFTEEVSVNGNTLPKGKYSFYMIPDDSSWTVIFNKSWNQWGTQYEESEDAVRFEVTPIVSDVSEETLTYFVEDITATSGRVVLAWDDVRVPFTIDVGNVGARVLREARRQMISEPVNAANYVLTNGIAGSYEEALLWLDSSLLQRETYGALFAKSRILGELGRITEAIAAGEKALEIGRASDVNPNSLAFLERLIRRWRSEE